MVKFVRVVQKIKENTTAAGKNNLKRTRESFEQGNELMKELGLTNSDKNKIFDLICWLFYAFESTFLMLFAFFVIFTNFSGPITFFR